MSRYSDDISLQANVPYPVSPDADNMFVSILLINDTANIVKVSLMGKESNYASMPASAVFSMLPKREEWPFTDRARTIWIKSTVAMTIGIIIVQEPLIATLRGKIVTVSPKGSVSPSAPIQHA